MAQLIMHFGTPLAQPEAKHKNIMKRLLTLVAVSNFLTLVCVAQPLTIDDCMRYAVENSVAVGKQNLALDDRKANHA